MTQEKRFCPNCGSSNVNPDFSHTNVLGEMMFDNNKWVCNECDYKGLMPENTQENKDSDKSQETKQDKNNEEDDDIDFEEKDQKTLDVKSGRAYFRYWAYILFPLTVIYILYLTVL